MHASRRYIFLVLWCVHAQAIDMLSVAFHAPSALMAAYLFVRPNWVRRTAERHSYVTTALVTTGWLAEHSFNVFQHNTGAIGAQRFHACDTALTVLSGATLLHTVCIQRNTVVNCVVKPDARPWWRCPG